MLNFLHEMSGIMGMIVSTIVQLVLVIAIGMLIYYPIYKCVMNKRLANGDTSKKPLPTPIKMIPVFLAIYYVVIMPLIVIIVFIQAGMSGVRKEPIQKPVDATMSFYCEADYNRVSDYFPTLENEGYTKQIEEHDGIRVSALLAKDLSPSELPHALLSVESVKDYPSDATYLIKVYLTGNGKTIREYQCDHIPAYVLVDTYDYDPELSAGEYKLIVDCYVNDKTGTRLDLFVDFFPLGTDNSQK